MTDKTEVGTATTPEFVLVRQYVSDPLAPQDILAATVKGQFRGWESSNAKNSSLAIAIRLVKRDGTDYGSPKYLIGATPAAGDAAAAPPEFPGTTNAAIINRKLNNSSESAALTSTAVYAVAGDRLVVEIGYLDQTSSTSTTCSINFGDDSATDLPEDDTTTAANNPWVDISQTLKFLGPMLNNFQSVSADTGMSVSERTR